MMEYDRECAVGLGPHAPNGAVVLFNATWRQTQQAPNDSRHNFDGSHETLIKSRRFSADVRLLPTRVCVEYIKAQSYGIEPGSVIVLVTCVTHLARNADLSKLKGGHVRSVGLDIKEGGWDGMVVGKKKPSTDAAKHSAKSGRGERPSLLFFVRPTDLLPSGLSTYQRQRRGATSQYFWSFVYGGRGVVVSWCRGVFPFETKLEAKHSFM